MADALRPDIEAAKKRMRTTLGSGREIKRLESYLWDGELVERMTSGVYGKGQGLVVLTDRRLIFLHDAVMSQTNEDFPLEKISSVQWQSGMLMGEIIVFASGNKTDIKNVNKNEGREIVDILRARLNAPKAMSPAPAVTPPSPVTSDDVMSKLKQLGELRDAGIIKPEDFETKKAELLSRI